MSNPDINATKAGAAAGDIPPAIDGYDVREKLGQGGMSTLWKAQQVSLGRDVVIKVLSSNLSRGVEDIKQFMFEARVAASLKHQGIVQVYDFGQSKTDSRYYFIMEFISGYSVGDWIRRKNHISDADALVVAQSVAEALRYAWNKSRIVHCDIKPDNIMVDGDGTIKLTDLGLAQAVGNVHTYTNQNGETLVMGTPNYMAPEQVRGETSMDCRTDIYALGASLYHMVSGHLPFMEADGGAAMELQINYYVQDPRKINPAVSAGMTRLIEKMMMKKPDLRQRDWTEVIEDIYLVQMGTMPVGEPPEPGESTVSVNRLREHAAPAAGARIAQASSDAAQPKKMKVKVLPATDGARAGQSKKPAPRQAALASGPVSPRPGQSAGDGKTAPERAGEQPFSKWQYISIRISRFFSNFFATLRMLLSITLIVYISYVMYMKFVRKIDVLAPMRERAEEFIRKVRSNLDFLPEKKESHRKEAPEPAEDAEDECEAGAGDVPEAVEEAETPEEPAETPIPHDIPQPAEDETAGAADNATASDIENTPAFKRILSYCEGQKPKPDESITLHLKDQDEPVTGTIHDFTPDGINLQVPEGLVNYPFSVMDEKTRQRFFPLENARQMYRRKYLDVIKAPGMN